MAWLGEGLSSLRGQITSFTKEVLSDGREEERDHEVKLRDAKEKILELESLCSAKDLEISKLCEINASFESNASQQQYEHRKQQQHPMLFNVGSSSSLGEFPRVYSFEDLGNAKKEATYDFSSMETEKDDLVDYLRAEIRALKIEKEKVEKKLQVFQKECKCSETSSLSSKADTVKDGPQNVENSLTKDQQAENSVESLETDLLMPNSESQEHTRVAQDGESHNFGGDVCLKKYDMGKQHPVQYMNIIKNLNDPDQQNTIVQGSMPSSENRLNISEDIAHLADMESTGKNWRIEDARGECDGSEEIPKEMVKLMDQINKLTVSLSDAQLNVNHFQEKEKTLLEEIDIMKAQEFGAEESIRNLKMQLEAAQESNFQLEQKLEELDKQHVQAIEQLISVKSSLQQSNEVLQSEMKELMLKVSALEHQLASCSSNTDVLNANESSLRREIELEMEKQILKFIPPELIPRENSSSGELSVMAGAVKGLANLCEEHRWKKETIEKKMAEMTKEAREAKAQCLQLRAEIAHRENTSGLRSEGLEPILETGEEEEEEDAPDAPAEDDIQNARAAMENKLAISNGDNLNLQKKCLALEEKIKRLRARERKESDLYDEEDEGDADGIEVANDWTWQADSEQNRIKVLASNELEEQIVMVSNDIQGSALMQTAPIRNDTPTLTEQYLKEKLKLEKLIEKLQDEKKILEVEKENTGSTIVKMQNEIKHLNDDLETMSKSSSELVNTLQVLKEKISSYETERELLEKFLAEKDNKLKELGSNIMSVNFNFDNERKKSDEMRKTIFELNKQIAQHEFVLKDKEELLNRHVENVKLLEDQNVSLQHSISIDEELKEEQYMLIKQLEATIEHLRAEFTKETKLKHEAIREAQEANEKCHDLDLKLSYEIQLKEEALNKLTDVEERFKIVEEGINKEMKSKNEFTDRIVELERRLLGVQTEAALDRRMKDEAVMEVSKRENLIANMESELSVVKQKLQEKESSLQEHKTKVTSLEMERERIMCVVGDKAREISSLRSERQRLMEAMSSMEKTRQKEIVVGDPPLCFGASNEIGKLKDESEPTETPPGEREELDDDGTLQLLAKLKSLQLESEQLAESYLQEQQRNKHLQNEVHEMMEKEASLQDELSRLRQHLVSVEDRYTKEAINAQDHIAFLKNKLTQVEERLHASSSAYTSASVRCNQQVKSLENQVRALTEKRDESKNQLLAAEEQLTQQAKDLANLQSVLEQFQRDKEREISVVKDKMIMEISSLERKCEELIEEITYLKNQLQQAKEGLNAAAQLSEQLDRKSEKITSLKAELKKLNANLISAEERLQSASLNVEGKVEKNLVKNLLLGYLSAPVQGSRRGEIIRIIATILEFSKEEKERVDVGDGGKSLGWLRGMSGWGGQHKDGAHGGDHLNQPSLSEAFIRFLESESRPKSQIRMLSDTRMDSNRSSSPASVQSSVPSSSSTPPLLMSESILPTLPTFSVTSGNNSSCILKDVLKDS